MSSSINSSSSSINSSNSNISSGSSSSSSSSSSNISSGSSSVYTMRTCMLCLDSVVSILKSFSRNSTYLYTM